MTVEIKDKVAAPVNNDASSALSATSDSKNDFQSLQAAAREGYNRSATGNSIDFGNHGDIYKSGGAPATSDNPTAGGAPAGDSQTSAGAHSGDNQSASGAPAGDTKTSGGAPAGDGKTAGGAPAGDTRTSGGAPAGDTKAGGAPAVGDNKAPTAAPAVNPHTQAATISI